MTTIRTKIFHAPNGEAEAVDFRMHDGNAERSVTRRAEDLGNLAAPVTVRTHQELFALIASIASTLAAEDKAEETKQFEAAETQRAKWLAEKAVTEAKIKKPK